MGAVLCETPLLGPGHLGKGTHCPKSQLHSFPENVALLVHWWVREYLQGAYFVLGPGLRGSGGHFRLMDTPTTTQSPAAEKEQQYKHTKR